MTTEAEKTTADVLYGSPPPPPPQPEEPPAAVNPVRTSPEAESLYGNGGEPLEDYSCVTSSLFDRIDYQGRLNGNEALLQESQEARQLVGEVLVDYQVGRPAAQKVMVAVGEIHEQPMSDEGYSSTWNRTLLVLKEKYGADAPKVLAAADKVMNEIEKRMPSASRILNDGLNVDPRFMDACIAAAKRKGYL